MKRNRTIDLPKCSVGRLPSTDKVATHWWLTKETLEAEVEARIVAAQNGVTKMRAYEVPNRELMHNSK